MVVLRVQHSFQGLSGLPRDRYVNSFYFAKPTIEAGDLVILKDAVEQFYRTPPAGAGMVAINSRMAPTSDAAGAQLKIYNMADAMPRPPLLTDIYDPAAIGAGAGPSLPTELAICLSYSAAQPTSIDPKRRRGRIFLGPFGLNALATSTTTDAIVDTVLATSIVGAAKEMAAVTASSGWAWSVFSDLLQSSHAITNCYVDNAWDVQRRRGIRPTARVSGVVPVLG